MSLLPLSRIWSLHKIIKSQIFPPVWPVTELQNDNSDSLPVFRTGTHPGATENTHYCSRPQPISTPPGFQESEIFASLHPFYILCIYYIKLSLPRPWPLGLLSSCLTKAQDLLTKALRPSLSGDFSFCFLLWDLLQDYNSFLHQLHISFTICPFIH